METLLGILFILILVAILVLPIAYVVWMVKTWRRGRKRLFWSQTAVAVIAVGAVVFCVHRTLAEFSRPYWERRGFSDHSGTLELTGRDFPLGKPLYCFGSVRGIAGGYTLAVYELTAETAHYFSSPPPEFFANYPKRPAYCDSGWRVVNWRMGPVKDDEQIFVDFASLGGDRAADKPDLDKVLESARRSLAKSTTHYAYRADDDAKPTSLDFFVIDPDELRLYLINSRL